MVSQPSMAAPRREARCSSARAERVPRTDAASARAASAPRNRGASARRRRPRAPKRPGVKIPPSETTRPRKTGANVERSRSRRARRTRGGSARGAPCSSVTALYRAMVSEASCGASGEWRRAPGIRQNPNAYTLSKYALASNRPRMCNTPHHIRLNAIRFLARIGA